MYLFLDQYKLFIQSISRHEQRDGRSVYWETFDISKEGELKVPFTFLVHIQSPSPNQCCGPHWVVVQVLFIHLHDLLDMDLHESYSIEYDYHLSRERAWTWCGDEGGKWIQVSCVFCDARLERCSACSLLHWRVLRSRWGPSTCQLSPPCHGHHSLTWTTQLCPGPP